MTNILDVFEVFFNIWFVFGRLTSFGSGVLAEASQFVNILFCALFQL